MIVTCPDCDTSFQLDESRIPQKGIRVRCSRCKHAFHLAHPEASQSEAIDAVAAEAAATGGMTTPGVSEDLAGPTDTDAGADAAIAVDAEDAPPRAPGSSINNEDAAEWEFNQDIPDSIPESGQGADALFGTMDRDGPSGLDLATGEADADAAPDVQVQATPEPVATEPAPPIVEVAAAAPSTAVEEIVGADAGGDAGVEGGDGADAFGSVDDFSSLMDDDPLDAIAAPVADHTADELRAQAAEQGSVHTEPGPADDLGDPENWDFFDGESPSSTPPPPPVQSIGQVAVQPAGSLPDEVVPKAARPAGPIADPSKRGSVAVLLESAGRAIGWSVVIVGFALGLVSGLWSSAESFVAGERSTAMGSIEAVDMRASWVDTARAGRLLVVNGGLRNPTRSAATIPGPLEVELLDRLGEPLGLPPVAAGVAISERQLRELPAAVIARVRSQSAQELQSVSIPAGGLLPFQVIMFDAPESGMRFEARLAAPGELSLPEPASATARADGSDSVAIGELDSAERVGLDASAASPLVGGDAMTDPIDPGAVAPRTGSTERAPGYDDPYGDDAGLGLQDL